MLTPSSKENSEQLKISQEDIAEIRNALAIILGNAQLLEREKEITQEQRKKLEIIGKQVYRIVGLLAKLEN